MIFSKISQKLAASAFFDDLHDPVVKLPKKLPSCVSIALNFQNAVAVWNSTAAPLGEESGISKTSCEISVKRFAKKNVFLLHPLKVIKKNNIIFSFCF